VLIYIYLFSLYFVPVPTNVQDASTNILTALLEGIESHFEFAVRQAPWTLLYRLLRSVPAPNVPAQLQSYQNILHLSYLSGRKTYCYIHPFAAPSQAPAIKPDPATLNTVIKVEPLSQAATPQPSQSITAPTPTTPGTIIGIPVNQTGAHLSYLTNQLSPLWALRQSLDVSQGITYAAGEYIIRIGEIRMARSGPSSTSSHISPGVVVSITTVSGGKNGDLNEVDSGYRSLETAVDGENSADFEEMEAEIRSVWTAVKTDVDLGKAEVREAMMERGVLTGEAEKEAEVRMWCEVLRLRG